MTALFRTTQRRNAAVRPDEVLHHEFGAGRKGRIVLLQTQAEAAGAQEISRILGRDLQARGYDVHHVFLFRRTAASDEHPNAFFCAPERPTSVLMSGRMCAALFRRLREVRADAIVCFQHYRNIVGALTARIAGTHVILANRMSAKTVVPAWAWWLELGLGCAGLFTRIVVNSKTAEDEYNRFPHQCQARTVRIEHGFEPKTTALRPNDARNVLGLPLGVPLLGSVGRLHPTKNLSAAVRLLSVAPGWHLTLAGQGPTHSELACLAKSLGVYDRVHFVGELPPDRVGVFFRALDVFVFPSLVETFGLAAVEAAHAGVPVVANDLEVLREVLAVDLKPCAVFVDVDDTRAFAASVGRILDDSRFRSMLSARGAELSRRFPLDVMTQRYAVLIESAIHGRR